MPSKEHASRTIASVACGVLTVSDTRTVDTDAGGQLIVELLKKSGHRIARREIVRDESEKIRELVISLCGGECDALLLTGGTGLAPRDTTFEAVAPLLEKRLDGFGELFRLLSYEDIGPAAMLSRAVGGIRGRTVIFAMPGSTAAVQLAMERLILPVLGHIAALLRDHGAID